VNLLFRRKGGVETVNANCTLKQTPAGNLVCRVTFAEALAVRKNDTLILNFTYKKP
jgi:hypothetical protein